MTPVRCFQLLLVTYLSLYVCSNTVNNSVLHTWWHDAVEYNELTPVADDHVRASTIYRVYVSTETEPDILYDSFTYMSIPRGGREKWQYNDSDGAEFSAKSRLTMSWSSFQFLTSVWITIELSKFTDRIQTNIDDLVIRPQTLNFKKQLINNGTARIFVPYRSSGYRFSVEFKSKLFTTFNYNNNPTEDFNGKPVHTEPRDALLIFAESLLNDSDISNFIPTTKSPDIYYPPQGLVNNLNSVSQSVIYFKAGIYYMPWNYHAHLPSNVRWLYLAPGAYLKGAFQFESISDIKVTGFGVLSGEKYVYEADVSNYYQHSISDHCWATCVKMLRFSSQNGKLQKLTLQGITVSDPPYHSFVVYGDENTFQMSVSTYHQVGSWYWQTDGLEIYSGSIVENSFFHSNDDVLKLYHSNVIANNVVVWKNENGPVIQWGWSPRTITNVTVDTVDIIHNRIWWSDIKFNTCLINSATYYADMYSTKTADPNQWINGLKLSNIRSEGLSPCAIRIYALSSTRNVSIKNLWIEDWNGLDWYSQVSLFKTYSNVQGKKAIIGNQLNDKNGLIFDNYMIGKIRVTKQANNWRDFQLGRLGFDGELWDNWDAI